MLKKLGTKNFRKLVDKEFEFGPGLQVIRGANEEGKSTIFEALAYLLGGVKACREELAAVVTWGQPEKSLAVTGTLVFDDVEYTAKRSKSGAEINYAGGRVVGQSECTAFWERLLGADMKTASRLMLSSQGEIRGALDQGSKPTMELIEGLANFDIIDEVLELVSTELVTGPPALAEDRVKNATAAAAVAQAAAVAPDIKANTARVAAFDKMIAVKEEELKVWVPQHDLSRDAVDAAQRQFDLRETLQDQAGRLNATLDTQEHQRDAALATAETMPDSADEEILRARLEGAEGAATRKAAFDRVVKLLQTYPGSFWEGDAASLQAEIDRVTAGAAGHRQLQALAEADVKLASQKHSDGTCPTCKQALPNAEEIARHNEAMAKKLADSKEAVEKFRQMAAECDAEVAALKAVAVANIPFTRATAELGAYVTVDWNFVPARLAWIGEEPVGVVDVAAIKAEIATLTKKAAAARAAQATATALNTAIAGTKATIANVTAQLEACAGADGLPELKAEFERVASETEGRRNDIADLRYQKKRVEDEVSNQETNYVLLKNAAVAAAAAQVTAEDELEALHFNNALLKRIRAARPMIADKLWTMVLSAVSAYFTAMRGEKSAVTRSANEFLVNGRGIGGLSGSTKDILGLAIRLALTRTFLPTTPFLILDEPAAAMDENRANATLGFLVAAGFPQTLLVTHEENSESVAQNLITI